MFSDVNLVTKLVTFIDVLQHPSCAENAVKSRRASCQTTRSSHFSHVFSRVPTHPWKSL